MAVDQQFTDRLAESSFSNAEWDVIMSVVEFELADPATPEHAHIEPRLDDLDTAVSAANDVPDVAATGPVAGDQQDNDRKGVMGTIMNRLGMGGGGSNTGNSDDRRHDAESLINEYSDSLEQRIKDAGEWQNLCAAVEGA